LKAHDLSALGVRLSVVGLLVQGEWCSELRGAFC
jgi:hypothetical protein